MNIYRIMLLSIIEPIVEGTGDTGVGNFRKVADTMAKDPDYYTVRVGEMLQRALNFIEMGLTIARKHDEE